MTSKALILVVALLAPAATHTTAGRTAPPNPYVDKGACPFECCTYRDWKTNGPITLLDKPGGRQVVATFAAGSTVHATTGEVISKPEPIVAKQDYADSPIRTGDMFYFLHYAGEGFSHVWFKGRVYDVELDRSGDTVEDPPSGSNVAWWARIRIPGGKSGWVLVKDQFENQDACG